MKNIKVTKAVHDLFVSKKGSNNNTQFLKLLIEGNKNDAK